MSFDAVIYEKRDGVAYVTLNRPQALNAINVQVRDDLFQIIPAIADDPDVGVAIIKGAGRAFSAGADVSEFGTAPSPVGTSSIVITATQIATLDDSNIVLTGDVS